MLDLCVVQFNIPFFPIDFNGNPQIFLKHLKKKKFFFFFDLSCVSWSELRKFFSHSDQWLSSLTFFFFFW